MFSPDMRPLHTHPWTLPIQAANQAHTSVIFYTFSPSLPAPAPLGLFWDIVTGLPWTPNGVGSLEPRGYCIFLPGAHYLTINSPYGADSSLNKLLLLLLLPLPTHLTPATTTFLQANTQSSPLLCSTCPNHLNLPRLATSATLWTPKRLQSTLLRKTEMRSLANHDWEIFDDEWSLKDSILKFKEITSDVAKEGGCPGCSHAGLKKTTCRVCLNEK